MTCVGSRQSLSGEFGKQGLEIDLFGQQRAAKESSSAAAPLIENMERRLPVEYPELRSPEETACRVEPPWRIRAYARGRELPDGRRSVAGRGR